MMYSNYFGGGFGSWGGWPWGMSMFWLAPLMLWSLGWKAWALWTAARRGEKVWFGVLLVVNTLGILEIIYLFAIAKVKIKGR